MIFTPHWQTYIGTHFLGLPEFKSKSVDPVFPNIFRYNYDIKVDVDLAEKMRREGIGTRNNYQDDEKSGTSELTITITWCPHAQPDWDKPIVTINGNRNFSSLQKS